MREVVASLLGFILAAVIPAAGFLAVDTLTRGVLDIEYIARGFFILYLFSLAMVLLFGIPAFALLGRHRPRRWWSVSATGFLFGALLAVLIRLPSYPIASDFLPFGILGALAALTFWWTWKAVMRTPPSNQLSP